MCYLLLCARQIFGIGLNPGLMFTQHEVVFKRSCDLLKRGSFPAREVADVFGDYREELILRTVDSTAVRIYTNTEESTRKMFTLLHDTTYRCGVAWQNNCYNQPCYPSFYYASDMDFKNVLRYL